MNTSGKKPKYIHQIYDEKVCVEQVSKQQCIGHKGRNNYFLLGCHLFFNIKHKTKHCLIHSVDCEIIVRYLGLVLIICVYPLKSSVNSVKGSEILDDIIICDLTENNAEVTTEIREGSPKAYEQG